MDELSLRFAVLAWPTYRLLGLGRLGQNKELDQNKDPTLWYRVLGQTCVVSAELSVGRRFLSVAATSHVANIRHVICHVLPV